MTSRKENIIIEQGGTFYQQFALSDVSENPIDFTGYTANAEVRKTYSSLSAVEFNASLANSTLTLQMTANNTALLEPGRFVYDVLITDTVGIKTRLMEGVATVTPSVTR